MSINEEQDFEDAAKRDLENRENDGGLFEKTAADRAKQDENISKEVVHTSLGKSSDWQTKNQDSGAEFKMGWHQIPVSNFPSGGIFYPEDVKVQIRAATVKEIRQFSVVSDDDPFSIDEGMNHIMTSCVNVNIKGKISNFKDILEEDRIFVVLAARELTFKEGENKMEIPYECNDCGHEGKMEFANENLRPAKVKDEIMKYFDYDEKTFHVKTKSSGVLNLRPPSIGVMRVITDWIKDNTQTAGQRKRLDQGFIKCLPFIVHDWRGFKKETIKDIQVDFMSWDATKYSTFFNVVDMIRVGVDGECHDLCTSCGSEVHSAIMFPGGVKSLFVVSDLSEELL
jgi:hypothetical protein